MINSQCDVILCGTSEPQLPSTCFDPAIFAWRIHKLPTVCGTCPSLQAPGTTKIEDNYWSSLWGCHREVGGFSVTCHWGAGKRNIVAIGSSCMPKDGCAPGLERQWDATTGSSRTVCWCPHWRGSCEMLTTGSSTMCCCHQGGCGETPLGADDIQTAATCSPHPGNQGV